MSEQLDESTKARITAQNEAGEAKSELVIIQVDCVTGTYQLNKTSIVWSVVVPSPPLGAGGIVCRLFMNVINIIWYI